MENYLLHGNLVDDEYQRLTNTVQHQHEGTLLMAIDWLTGYTVTCSTRLYVWCMKT